MTYFVELKNNTIDPAEFDNREEAIEYWSKASEAGNDGDAYCIDEFGKITDLFTGEEMKADA